MSDEPIVNINFAHRQLKELESSGVLDSDLEIVKKALAFAQSDPGAMFEPAVVAALSSVKNNCPADYQRIRIKLKGTKSLSITDLERQYSGDRARSEESIGSAMVAMATDRCSLFNDEDGAAYATFDRNGHTETWPIEAKGFSEWLGFATYKEENRVPRSTSMSEALETLAGKAKFDGPTLPVSRRVAEHNGNYYIDLCNDSWQVVEITSTGWRITDDPPVRFMRTSTMRALPIPIAGGSVDLLWPLINIDEKNRHQLLAWMLECFRPNTAYVVLELTGEQGSAKSTLQNYIRDLIDPNKVNLRSAPKSREDIFVAANNGHLVSFENLSHLPAPYQDALCSMATGAGYSTRKLYTTADEDAIETKRPTVLNGISVVVTAQDLLDRTLHFDLPRITSRRTDGDLKSNFESCKPSIFGGLLDLFSRSLAALPETRIESKNLPRMADFALLGEALYSHLGYSPGEFVAAYRSQIEQGVHQTIDALPVPAAVLQYFEEGQPNLVGVTYAAAWKKIAEYQISDSHRGWPRSPKGFADGLRRSATGLRIVGVEVIELGHSRAGNLVTIRRDRETFEF